MRRVLTGSLTAAFVAVNILAGGFASESSVVRALPPEFSDEFVASFSAPTAVEQLPDGRLVVLEKATGRVRFVDIASGQSGSTVALDLSVCSNSERGLLGFTHDPDVLANGRVYVYYTRFAPGFPNGCVNRVSAFTLMGSSIDPNSEQVLIDNISSLGGNHNGGDVEIGNDGALYVGVGDAGRDPRGDSGSAGVNDAAQDLSLLNGKILRVDRFTGFAAPGNPFTGPGTVACRTRGNLASTPSTICREIFSYGLRNPFRFAFDSNTSATRFFINDVGQDRQEEVNEGAIGANYGWPAREGNCPQGQVAPCAGPGAGITDPITSYDHQLGRFITAGAFVPDGAWPEAYDGAYLFADGGDGKMWLRTSDGNVEYGAPFSTGVRNLADMAFVLEPAGWALYYTDSSQGELRKITVAAPPAAAAGPLAFAPLATPDRAFDSRQLDPATRLRGGTTRLIDIGAPAGASAALVNVTLRNPSGTSFATAWKPRTQRPASSNVNALNGETVANSSVFPLDESGRLLLYVQATSHVIVDVAGFFVEAPNATSSGRFVPGDPSRIVDTRASADDDQNEYIRTETSSNVDTITVPVAGRAGIPESGVSAVAFIATGINRGRPTDGFAIFGPSGSALPSASSLNTNAGVDQRANLVVVPLGVDGAVQIQLTDVDHLLIDVAGYFTDADADESTSGRFTLVPPRREVDTRSGLGLAPFGAGQTGVLDPVSVPAEAVAVVQNLTVAPSGATTFVTAFPTGTRPNASNLNATGAGQIRAALALTRLDGGAERIYADGATQLIVDVQGYFS